MTTSILAFTPYDQDIHDAVLLELSHLPHSWAVVRRRASDGAVTDFVAQLQGEGHARGMASRLGASVMYVGRDGVVAVG